MGLTAPVKAGGEDYEPVPAGLQIAILYGLFDIGTHREIGPTWDTDVHKVVLLWELPEQRIEIDGKDLPRAISKRYRLSLHKKAHLRHHLESWRSRAFTDEEIVTFDFKKLLGIPCQLNIVHNHSVKNDRLYANVSSIVPVPMGTELKPENPLAFFSFEEWPAKGIPVNTPDWIQKEIKSSYEWTGEGKKSEPQPQEQGPPIDDYIPF
jgi:hypothetical protein